MHLRFRKIQDLESSKKFDWKQYLENYEDLRRAGIHTKNNAWKHWIQYGNKEGRTFYKIQQKSVESLCDIKIENITYENFDWKQYFKKIREQNPFNKITIENKIVNISSDNFTCINEEDIVITKHLKIDYKFTKINNNELDILKNYILVVDFPNIGGGTTHFLNTIISKYKFYNTFVIARNFDNMIVLTINDDYELNNRLTQKEAVLFLENQKNKIDKIFVNHTLSQNKIFLDKIYELEKEKIFITHDYYSINTNPQPLINFFYKEQNSNLNKYNKIITQNKNNLYIFNDYITNKNIEIIVTELPDFKEKDALINTGNNKIVIGIIGLISNIKGKTILEDIIKYYSNNNNVSIVVFGQTDIKYFKNQFIYKNINELNELFELYKPNILLELSIWPETYSYTLTLSMITDLPILYVKKTGTFTVEERLSRYSKGYAFENLEELDNLVIKHKQDYFYTILPYIYYNTFWNKLFNYDEEYYIKKNNNSENINVVFITSKIYISNQIFSYINTRSIYTKEERLFQTLETIKSVRKNIPKSYIILLDNSIFQQNEKKLLESYVDVFLNILNEEKLNYFTNDSIYKSYGEISQTYFLIKYLKKIKNKNIINLFKITGRYLINDNFNYENYKNENNIFKLNKDVTDRKYIYTCFYKISNKNLDNYILINDKLFNDIQSSNKYDNIDYEVLFPAQINDIKFIDYLGIMQNVAVWNDKTNI